MNLGLSQEQINDLGDKEFIEAAALAYFIEDRRVIAIKRGILMALQEIVE